jgi:hypothetical protein
MKTINQKYFVNHEIDPGGEIGRHAGLKILWAAMSVRVQVPPGVQKIRARNRARARFWTLIFFFKLFLTFSSFFFILYKSSMFLKSERETEREQGFER